MRKIIALRLVILGCVAIVVTLVAALLWKPTNGINAFNHVRTLAGRFAEQKDNEDKTD